MVPGELADSATTFGETKKLSIRVTDETAAGGRQSLKFTDARYDPKPHWPWLAYRPKVSGATVRASFDLCLEKGANVWHEWRTGGNPYKIGPSVRIMDGKLLVAGKTVTEVPVGEWFHIEIVAAVGNDGPGVFEMVVALANREPLRLRDLPLRAGKDFAELEWLGFVSLANEKTAFYLDNVRLDTIP